MQATEQISVTLPKMLADQLRARVASGEYASESAVVIDGLLSLDLDQPDDEALEHWLRTEAAAAYDEMEAHPELALSLEQVEEDLARERERRNKRPE